MRWLSGRRIMAIAAALALGTSGCGVPTEAHPRMLDPSAAPYRAVAVTPEPAPTGSRLVHIFLVSGDILEPVARRVPSGGDVDTVLRALLAGPTEAESGRGLTSATPRELSSVVLSPSGVAVVGLPGESDAPGRSDEALGYAQIVLTLVELKDVDAVQFLRDGELLAVPRGDGSVTERPLTRSDFLDLLGA
jgi:hypothetical protein